MKKIIFVLLLLVFFGIKSYSQAGDLHIGAQGGYITVYKNVLYGLNTSYDVSNTLQFSLTGLMNPSITIKDGYNADFDEHLSVYSANLDGRIFIINQELWAMGPSLGGQYLITRAKKEQDAWKNVDVFGFNIGWHLRANITENLRTTLGWRYTSAKEESSHHYFYLGIGYAFNLF